MTEHTPEQIRGFYELQVMVILAGKVAWDRALRADLGWVTNWNLHQLTTIHEAAHAVVLTVGGDPPAFIEAAPPTWTPEGPRLHGLCSKDEHPSGDPDPSDDAQCEFFCRKIDPENWEAVRADLEHLTGVFVDDNWQTIKSLALETCRKGKVFRPEILAIVRAFSPTA